MSRRVAVVTGSRADYGLLYWILKDLQASADIGLQLCVTGAHLEPQFGRTVDAIRADGMPIAAEVPSFVPGDTPEAATQSIARGVAGFGDALSRLRPDVLLLMADRYEIFAAAAAAVALRVPIAHLSGGESTEGLFDDQLRHAITKLAHLHFASMELYRDRIVRMGERPERVFSVGEPGLDHCRRTSLLDRDAASAAVGLDLAKPTAVVTFHPVTLEPEHTARYVSELLNALATVPELQLVMSYPGADPGATIISAAFEIYAAGRSGAVLHKNLGTLRYLSLLRHAGLMVGNSSSGLVEAPSFELPVLNIGSRQGGRVRAANVLDVDCRSDAIAAGIRRLLAPGFREALRGLTNPYGDGRTSERVVRILRTCDLAELRYKPFYDGPDKGGGADLERKSTDS